MPQTKPAPFFLRLTWSALVLAMILAGISGGCVPTAPQQAETITVWLEVEGIERRVTLPAGATVQNALDEADIQVNVLDKVKPPTFTTLSDQDRIQVIRVQEVFEIEEQVIPFESQKVRNESLPEGQRRLIQAGENGILQITYRQVFEDNIPGPRTVFSSTILKEAKPEILMVGVQAPFAPISFPGTIAYLTAGNAWMMENTTGNRMAVINTGDLDGRVFRLSPDGDWLLYTRQVSNEDDDTINSLWAVNLRAEPISPIDLQVKNVIHFADWVPGANLTIAYSTVEPRPSPPGWQANNDLYTITIHRSGTFQRPRQLIEANYGGIYGWWGAHFAWSPDGAQLAYARPDSVGLVDLDQQEFVQRKEIIPLQTRSDWAWVPGIDWSEDSSLIYTVAHVPLTGLATHESSPVFDVCAIMIEIEGSVCMASKTGMFAYPSPSPLLADGNFIVAYLQAIFPEKSETSRYRLMLMDQDGSNRRLVFPPEGSPGLEAQKIIWGPLVDGGSLLMLGVIYQGNLWIIQPDTGLAQQITGDGSIAKIDWQ